ncbi:uncharacterized protein LOC132144953 isoform X4 [Carassius carassius]|uniref:uncharacterized protein LOC132144953 isoform X4 n=1 Tax=Carassius carassius TaxID=217509 RepID=UPI0028695E95|nr:uncharacterized protein LOC132144953 isoform X4 [Carassius carassius]
MENIMLFCVFSYLIVQISSSEHDVTLLRFQLNESITLNCNMTYNHEIAWYHQNPESGRLTLVLSTLYNNVLSYQRHRIFAEIGTNRASLVITRLNESDSGLYFCGTPKESDMQFMYFNKPIRLVMEDKLTDREDKVQSVTDPPEDDEITVSTVEVMLTERVMVFGGVCLAVLQFFLATVVAGGIIHCYGWQKGWAAAKRAVLTD